MSIDIIDSPFARATFSYVDELAAGEREWVRLFREEMARYYAERNVEVTPLTLIRLDGVVQEYLAARRLTALPLEPQPPQETHETKANPESEPDDKAAPPPKEAAPQTKGRLALKSDKVTSSRTKDPAVALIEAAGKARERMRKAMEELEKSTPEQSAPRLGLADEMRPLVLAAKGVLKEVLEPRPSGASAQQSNGENPP
ncbi:MAG: hypothetical protein HZB26_14215 [Candidatus Hydrogenedentes bacterium]|nr:hypothetical protein [Candidatus Hydrogenedentota bacterium]